MTFTLLWHDNPSWTSLLSVAFVNVFSLSLSLSLCRRPHADCYATKGVVADEEKQSEISEIITLKQCIIIWRQTVPRFQRLWSRWPRQSSKNDECTDVPVDLFSHLFLLRILKIHLALSSAFAPSSSSSDKFSANVKRASAEKFG